jgi:hypothetical protein
VKQGGIIKITALFLIKNYMLRLSIFLCTLSFGFQLSAQTASEVLKYAGARSFGSARASGCASAMGALGADFTAININPAGIGMYRKSDFYVSFSGHFDRQESTLKGSANLMYSKEKEAFSLSGIGLVFTSTPMASRWSNVNFAINIGQTAEFDKSFFFKGRSVGSITDRFLELALDPNQTGLIGLDPDDLDPFEAGLAYETGAIFDPGTDPFHITYTTDLLNKKGYLLPKEQLVTTKGGLYDVSLGLGAHYDEKIAVGVNLVIPIGEFSSSGSYKEYESVANEVLPFKNLEFNQNLKTSIAGIAANFGIIIKPFPSLRLGLAWKTPTYLWMKDEFTTSLTYSFNNGIQDTSFTAFSPDGSFDYRLRIPSRTVLSMAYIGRIGFLSADIDFFNVRNSRYNLTANSNSSADYEYQEIVNADIRKQYKPAVQYRFGGELALSYLRIRGGFEFIQQAYANSSTFDSGYSFGMGFRGNRFYLDAAYKYTNTTQTHIPYLTGNSDFDGNGSIDAPTPLVDQKSILQQIQLTFGFKL